MEDGGGDEGDVFAGAEFVGGEVGDELGVVYGGGGGGKSGVCSLGDGE